MAAIHPNDDQYLPPETKCYFCLGRSPSAYWHGFGEPLAICRVCAVEILPRLIAEALAGYNLADVADEDYAYCFDRPSRLLNVLEEKLPAIERAYWKGVAHAVVHHAESSAKPDRGMTAAERRNWEQRQVAGINGEDAEPTP